MRPTIEAYEPILEFLQVSPERRGVFARPVSPQSQALVLSFSAPCAGCEQAYKPFQLATDHSRYYWRASCGTDACRRDQHVYQFRSLLIKVVKNLEARVAAQSPVLDFSRDANPPPAKPARGESITVVPGKSMLEKIDTWRREEGPGISRPQAVIQLVTKGLHG